MNDLADLFGLLTVLAYLMGTGAVTVRAWMLSGPGERRLSVLLIVVAVLYLGFILGDAVSVLTVLSNGVGDIPPVSSARTGLFAVWVWALHSWMLRRCRRQPCY